MNWGSAIAIYFVIWWTVLFAVLPFGVRNSHETGAAVEDGNDAGAPVAHGMLWKAGVTTVIAAVIFAGLYGLVSSGALERIDLPLMQPTPKL